MKNLLIVIFCLFCMSCKPTVNLILDTDLGYGFDDVGAMAMMHALADSGQVKILATLSSNQYELSVPCIEVINAYFSRPHIPIGASKGKDGIHLSPDQPVKWTEILASKYPHQIKNTEKAPDAVKVYRNLLSKANDQSITICSIGFFTSLKDLLLSEADEYSKLTGKELVKKKVIKLIAMAGSFPEGKEFNLFKDALASQVVVREWPTEIIFSGSEIGSSVITGQTISGMKVVNSPVRDAYELCTKGNSHYTGMSWDQTAILVAIKGHEPYYTVEQGECIVAEDGSNTWEVRPDGKHFRLIEKMSPANVARIIENYMNYQPVN